MTSIDNRIVQMQFDNAQFERGAKQSLNTLDNIKKGLDFSKVGDSFGKISQAANSVDLSGIQAGVEALQNRFSTWGIVGMQVISELTTAAINAGKKLANISIGQIITGGKARASNIQKAQLMLEGLLKTEEGLTDFGKVTDVMNDATDAVNNTAYGLDEAALVASQLAASGVGIESWSHDLSGGFEKVKEEADPMARSLMAVSGLAAMTSSSYSDIGQIFTTVAGNGKLMSMQLQQLSGRGINAAATMAEQWGKTEAQVRDMVSNGKVTYTMFADAMYDAFAAQAYKANRTLTGVMSNTKAALSKIGADLFTPMIQNTSEAGNGLTNLVNVMDSVRAKLNAFRTAFSKPLGANPDSTDPSQWGEWVKFVDNYSKLAKKAIDSIDAAGIGKTLLNIANNILPKIWSATEKALPKIEWLINKMKDGLEGLKTIFKFFQTSIPSFFKYIHNHFGIAQGDIKNITDLIKSIYGYLFRDFLNGIKLNKAEIGELFELIQTKFRRIIFEVTPQIDSIFETIESFFRQFFGRLIKAKNVENLEKILLNLEQAVLNFNNALKGTDYKATAEDLGGGLADGFTLVLDVVTKLSDFLLPVGTALGKIAKFAVSAAGSMGKFVSKVKEVATSNDKIQSVLDLLKDVVTKIADLDINPLNLLAAAIEAIHTAFQKLGDGLKVVWDGFKKFVQPFVDEVKKMFSNLKEMISSPFNGNSNTSPLDIVMTFIRTIAAIKVASIGADLVNLFKKLGDSLMVLTKNFNGMSADNLKSIAVSIGILAASLVVLASVDGEKLGTALGTIAFGLGEIIAVFYGIKGSNIKKAKDAIDKNISGKGGIIAAISDTIKSYARGGDSPFDAIKEIATALLILASAMKVLSTIDGPGLETAMEGMTAAFAELLGVYFIMQKIGSTDQTKTAKAVQTMAWALVPVAIALKALSTIEPNQLAVALFGMAAALGAMAAVVKVLSTMSASAGEALASAASILLVSLALIPIATTIALLSLFDYTTMGQSMTILLMTLGGLAAIIGLLANNLDSAGTAIAAAASMLLVALSLIPISAALATVSATNPSIESIVTLVGTMVMIAGMLAAVAAVGAKAIVAAASIAIVAASLLAIAISLKIVASTASDEMGGALLTMIVTLGAIAAALAALSPVALAALPAAAAIAVVAAALLAMSAAVKLLSTIDPQAMMISMLGLATALGILAVAGIGLGAMAPTLLSAAAGVAAFSAACIVLGVAILAVGAGLFALGAGVEAVVEGIVNAIVAVVNGIADVITGIGNILAALVEAVTMIAMAIVNTIRSALGIHSPSVVMEGLGEMAVQGLINGIKSLIGAVGDAIGSVVKACIDGLGGLKDKAVEIGGNFISGLVNGITSGIGAIGTAIANIGSSMVGKLKSILGIHSPSKEAYKIGEFFNAGLDKGVRDSEKSVIDSITDVGNSALSGLKLALAGVNDISNDMEFTPTITPVLDLSQIQNGSSRLASLFDSAYTAQAAASVSSTFTSPAQSRDERMNAAMSDAMKQLIESQQGSDSDTTYTFNIPLEVNGRQIAKATRSYNKTELDNLDIMLNRKAGIK